MKRITIRDIAKMLSISPSTVSRALSDHPDISKRTKDRVTEVANAFNYTVNLHSNFFRNKKSNLIALILPEINMFFTPNLIKSMNKILAKTGFSLYILITDDKYEKEVEMVEQCIKWAVEGVLISLSKQTKNVDHLSKLLDFEIKTVLLDRIVPNRIFHTVVSDSFGSSYKAVNHLVENGHVNILGIFDNPNLRITQRRIAGFKAGIKELNLNHDDCPILTSNNINDLDKSMPLAFSQFPNITAVFVMSDELLAKSQFIINILGKKIYDDLSLIAISDGSYPYIIYPNITYVKDSGIKLGKKAIHLLLDLIDGNKTKKIKKNKLLKTKLIKLDSVKDIKHVPENLVE